MNATKSNVQAKPRVLNKRRLRLQAQAKAAMLALAPSYDLVIIGGGAAGLASAIYTAEHQVKTLILEKDYEVGRSILATGNGRCNFSNLYLEGKCFNDPDFASITLGATPLQDILSFFRESGLLWAQKEGRLYPRSLSAASVRNVLVQRAQRAGVTFGCCREVRRVAPSVQAKHGADRQAATNKLWNLDIVFTVDEVVGEKNKTAVAISNVAATKQVQTIQAKQLIIAAGRGATQTNLLENLAIPHIAASPVLCPLYCEDTPLMQLDGKRCTAKLSLYKSEFPSVVETGELLFRSYGLSGIAIFNLSRHASEGDTIELDLIPEYSEGEINQRFFELKPAAISFDGMLDPAIAQVVQHMASEAHETDLVNFVKHLRVKILGRADLQSAQVTRGGFATDAFDPQTLEAHNYPGLHCVGEALNIDGACGGFNLSWAWKSGLVAAQHVCNALKTRE